MKKILVTGTVGQIGSELTPALRAKYGNENVIAAGHRTQPSEELKNSGPFIFFDVTNYEELEKAIKEYDIDTIFHMSNILSARGEQNPQLAYKVNFLGTYNVLEAGRKHNLEKVIYPSSIAAFGPDTPKDNTPNETILRPSTMYGVSKVANELLGNYYFQKYGLDVRGVRFPGIISWKTPPGGGTTDYAVDIYYHAVQEKNYNCFVRGDTVLPMMYMPDAVKCLIDLAEADLSKLKHHSDYNVTAMSFSASELADEIKKHYPDFETTYQPDSRQQIADSWPKSLDDSAAREEWGWKPDFGIEEMTKDMITNLKKKLMG